MDAGPRRSDATDSPSRLWFRRSGRAGWPPPSRQARPCPCLPSGAKRDYRSGAALALRADVANWGGRTRVADSTGATGRMGRCRGMLDLVGIPYVGSGVLASALAMDKAMANKVLAAEGIPVPPGVVIEREEFDKDSMRRAHAFVPPSGEPSRQGA